MAPKIHCRYKTYQATHCGRNRRSPAEVQAVDEAQVDQVTCRHCLYGLRRIPSPHTGPKSRSKTGWARRIEASLRRSLNGDLESVRTAARNVLSMLKAAGWRKPTGPMRFKP